MMELIDMLKQTLATHFMFTFLGLLSSVTSEAFLANTFDYDSLPIPVTTFKQKCSERFDSFACSNQDTIRYKPTDSEPSKVLNPKQTKELIPENRMSGKEIPQENSADEISIGTPVLDPENHLQKRFSVFRIKSPIARGYKRGPGFRSWGGKRDSTLLEQNLDKKSKFASWGGKRDGEYFPDDLTACSGFHEGCALDKRQKFQNWGGKRRATDYSEDLDKRERSTPDDVMEKKGLVWKNKGFYLSEPFKKHVPKRPQFQSWGGKRAQNPWRDLVEFLQQKPKILLSKGEKRKFSSWGGKRFIESQSQCGEPRSEENSKRTVFQNWGGKRWALETNSHKGDEVVFPLKDSETKIKDEQAKADCKDVEPSYDFNSWGDELMDGKDGR